MTTWREYIEYKFGDPNKYIIIEKEDGESVEIRSTDKDIETIIEFVFVNESELEDIHFWGSDLIKCAQWMSHFTLEKEFQQDVTVTSKIKALLNHKYYPSFLPFNENTINRVEKEWLYIPLRTGWKEEVSTLGDTVVQSNLIVNEGIYQYKGPKYIQSPELSLFDEFRKFLNLGVKQITYKFKPLN